MSRFHHLWFEAGMKAVPSFRTNDIGIPGELGVGVGIYPGSLPSGFSEMSGTPDVSSANYGNYQYNDGSVMAWRPAFYYRIGHPDNPTFAVYGLNSVDIQPERAFASRAVAAAAGYALHRSFINAGEQQRGFMVDKYQCSNNGGIASSIKNGDPLSSNAAHNPFSGLTGSHANDYSGALTAAKTRGSQFHCASRFEFITGAMISIAHGQRARLETCAWFDEDGETNYPKGNNANTNPPRDVDDATVIYTASGYLNCGKTGSASDLAKTTDNGQACGVADLNGNMWEINTGMTRPGSGADDVAQQNDAAAFYILKEGADVNALTSGWNAPSTAAWGNAAHLATLYDPITLAHITHTGVWNRFGNGTTNQVMSEAVDGDGYRMTGAGIYLPAGKSTGGSSLFGIDGLYEYHRANLCLLSGGNWVSPSIAGLWSMNLYFSRTNSTVSVGVRCAAYV